MAARVKPAHDEPRQPKVSMTIHLNSQSDLEDAVHALVKQDVRLEPIFELTGMKQAASLREVPLPLLLPGITVSTGADGYLPFQQLRLRRFDGKSWVGFDEILDDG